MDEGFEGLEELACVKGHLRDSYVYWRDVLQAPETILVMIQTGSKLSLLHEPPPFHRPNNVSNLYESFVTESVLDLQVGQCIRVVQDRPQLVLCCSVKPDLRKEMVSD